jgi:hypothetical protein
MILPVPASKRRLTLVWVIVLALAAHAEAQSTTAANPAPPVPPAPTIPAPAAPAAPVPAATAPAATEPATPPPPATTSPPPVVPATAAPVAPAGPILGMQPADYLDCVGQKVKARWRQLYRGAPPPASTERLGVAFTLGGLMAESHLAVQAGDAQQFRNNNQEVQKLCNILALSDKIGPDINAGSKMAETEDWPALRKQVLVTQQHIDEVLNMQRDEDLAILMGIGLWVRLFDISTSLVINDPDLQDKSLCIGSLPMLNELAARYERLSDSAQSNDAIALIGGVLEVLQRNWTRAEGKPSEELVRMTHDKLKYVISKVEAK